MVQLVAIRVGDGSGFVAAIRRVWGQDNAFCVLDDRLPYPETKRQLAALGVDLVMDQHGQQTKVGYGQRVAPLLAGDALVVNTSGSTGEPKAVVHTHNSIAASATATSAALNVNPKADVWLACLPLTHIGGLSVVLRAMLTNTPVLVHPQFDPTAVAEASDSASLVSLVTRALRQIDATQFRRIVLGGAAPPADRPENSTITYGLTETGSGVVYDHYPIGGAEIRADTDQRLAIRGPMVFRTYRSGIDEPDHGPVENDGWFVTGDLGTVANDGYVTVLGRQDDIIVTGGEKVWPQRTEAALRALSEVDAAAVIGLDDPEWGSVVAAVVTCHKPAQRLSLEHVRERLCTQLPVWYAPKKLLVVERLPQTRSGKTDRRRLSELFSEQPRNPLNG